MSEHVSSFNHELFLAGSDLRIPDLRPLEEEQKHRKERLAIALRVFGYLGFEHGLAGHFSARDPIRPDLFWMNPLGIPFGKIRASDLSLVSGNGTVVEGPKLINQSGVPYHDEIQKARPDVVGIAHAHAFFGRTWSAFRRPLLPITAEASFFHQDQALFDPALFAERIPSSPKPGEQGQIVAEALGNKNTLIWFNHGVWAVGTTVEVAAWRFLTFEDAARSQLVAQAADVPPPPPPAAVSAEQRARQDVFAHYSFLSLWDRISDDNRDVTE